MDDFWTNYYIDTILRNTREDEERKLWHNNQEKENIDETTINTDTNNEVIEFTWNGTEWVRKEEMKSDKL